MVTGAALGTATLLGWPAPEHVKREIAAVDRGLPEDLRLNPDVEHASAVASNGSSTLYAAALKDGGRCTELVTPRDRGRGATCSTGADQVSRPIDVTVPSDDSAGDEAPVVLAGRLNAAQGAELAIAYEDGGSDAIPLGDDRYFVFDGPGRAPSLRARVRVSPGRARRRRLDHRDRAPFRPTGTARPFRTKPRRSSSAPARTSRT